MFQLSEAQADIVYKRLQHEKLKSVKLEEDLFDHFCCYMEAQMDMGDDFELAYQKAVRDIAPNGLKEIEFEMFFIINFNKQVSMKKLIFFTGFTATFLLSTGIMFHTMHWFAARMLLFSGFVMLLVTMIVLAIHAARFLHHQSTSFWVRTCTGIASFILIAVGFMFRILHMPGANVMYGLGTILLNFLFLPLFFYHLYKDGFAKSSPDKIV